MFDFFRRGYYFIRVWDNRMELVDLESNKVILKKATNPFSTKRVVLAHFFIAEKLMRSMFEELEGKRRFHRQRYVAVQQVDYPEGGLTSIERRALIDSCEHAGATNVMFIEPGSQVTNADALHRLMKF